MFGKIEIVNTVSIFLLVLPLSKKISKESKEKLGYGTGIGKGYKPYITTSELNSKGTTVVIKDWKSGRGVHCLSQGEALWYYVLRWNDDVIDIREQFPLEMQEFNKIADDFGISRVKIPDFIATTDFLVTMKDDSKIAYSIKSDRNLSERTLQLLCVEKTYWINRGVRFKLLFKENVNRILANNIRLVVEFFDENTVFDDISMAKYLIANKKVGFDLSLKPLDIETLRKQKLV